MLNRRLLPLVHLLVASTASAQLSFVAQGASTQLGAWYTQPGYADYRRGSVVFVVGNTSAQTQTLYVSSSCGAFALPGEYDPESGGYLPGECPGDAAPNGVVVAAGQSVSVTVPLALYSGGAAGSVTLRSWAASNPSAIDVAVATVAYSGTTQSFTASLTPTVYVLSLSPKNGSTTVASNGDRAYVFSLANGMTVPVTYALAASCTGSLSGCALSAPSVAVQGSSSSQVSVSFHAPAAGTFGTVRLIATAPATQSGAVRQDTATVAFAVQDLAAPTISFSPSGQFDTQGEVYGQAYLDTRASVAVNVCDLDGTVGTPVLTLGGVSVPATSVVATNVGGCFTAKTATFSPPFQPGSNAVTLSVSDGVHTTTITQSYVYNDVADHRPVVAAVHPSPAVAIGRAATDTFRVTNPGWRAVDYQLVASCIQSNGAACTASAPPSVAVAAGATASVAVSFVTAPTVGMTSTVTLTATYTEPVASISSGGTFVATVAPLLPPVVTIEAIGGTTVTQPKLNFRITWCDPDDGVVSRTASWQGGALPPPYEANSGVNGCASWRWQDLPVEPWQIQIDATATDQQGHQTSASQVFTYMAPMTAFQPAVTPKAGTNRRSPAVAAADTFRVRNAGLYAASYSLSGACGALGGCTVNVPSVWLPPGGSANVAVLHASSNAYDQRDTVRLIASYSAPGGTIADTGRIVSTVPSREVAPAVSYPLGIQTAPPTYVGLSQFSITNGSSTEIAYDVTLVSTGGWGVPDWFTRDSLVTIAAGQSKTIFVYTKAPNTEGAVGEYTLTASYTTTSGARLTGSATALWMTQIARPAFAVMPKGGVRIAPRGQVDQDVMFTVVNTGNVTIGGAATAHCDHRDLVASCEWGAWNGTYGGFSVPPGGTADVRLTIHPSQNAALTNGQVAAVVDIVNGATHVIDSGWVNLHSGDHFLAVAVSPKGMGPMAIVPGGSIARSFTIENIGDTTSTFHLESVCSGGAIAHCDAPSPVQLTLAAGASAGASVHFDAGAAGSTATLRLTATETTHPAVSDTGSISFTTQVAASFAVDARGTSAGANVSRDECLTIEIAAASAYECGDLRVVHSLPAVTTMGRTRVPTLVYNSRHQSGVVLFPVDVTVPLGASVTYLDAHVIVAGHDSMTRFAWLPEWSGAGARRIVVPINARLWGLQTGAYQYAVAVDFVGSGTMQVRDTGTVAIVNRAESAFGAGWWLDGLEQLVPVSFAANRMLWVGGDGSTRLYAQMNDSVWTMQPTLDRPDTLIHRGLNWYRELTDGAYVQFDNAGRHIATVNRRGHQTMFGYDPAQASLLTSIDVPVPAASTVAQPARRYTFSYGYTFGGRAYLSGVTAPPAPNAARLVAIGHQSGTAQVDRMAGPDTTAVSFDYLDGNRLTGRTDRRGYRTAFTYDVASMTLRQSTIQMRGTGDDIVAGYCAAEAASLAPCQPGAAVSDTVRTTYDGPRTDVDDTTRFFITPYGAPRRTIDALGHVTTIERKSSTFPLLATAVIRPNGFTSRAAYNARGLIETHTDERPLAPASASDAITRYVWNAASPFDQLDTIVGPTGETTRFGYFANGDRQWQEDGRGPVSRVWFTYGSDRQIATIQSPGNSTTQVDSVAYDALLGNVAYTRTPMLFKTSIHRDALGRADIVSTPIDSAQTQFRVATTTYDLFDRAVTVSDSAPIAGATSQALLVQSTFDPSGNLTLVTRLSVPDTAHIGLVLTEYTYDGAGRRLTEHDPAQPPAQVASWTYDPAGNVRFAYTKGRSSVSMQYDGLNRLTHRVIPRIGNRYGSVDDVQDFDYDEMGRTLSARNAFAAVTRTYTKAGLVEMDSLAVRAADLSAAGMRHGYRLINHYDLSGRRVAQEQPGNVAITGSLLMYGYDSTFGALRSITDPAGNVYRLTYTPDGSLDSLIMPGAVVAKRFHDADGREVGRVESGPMGVMHDEGFSRDATGRILAAGGGGQLSAAESGTFGYTGLGAARRSFITTGDDESLRMTTDAFGQLVRKQQDGTEASPGPKIYGYLYEPNSNRLSRVDGQLGSSATDALMHAYDASGNLTTQVYSQTTPPGPGEGSTRPPHIDAAWRVDFGFDAAGRLMAAERWTVSDRLVDLQNQRTAAAKALGFGSYEEYRYDALGRRIWKRTHRDWYCTDQARLDPDLKAECASATVLTVWDGDQVLYELRAPAADSLTSAQLEANLDSPAVSAGGSTLATQFGTVMYVHAGGIDRPIALQRDGRTLVLHTSWRGLVDASTNAAGQYSTCGLPSAIASCEFVKWPGTDSRFSYQRSSMLSLSGWYGDMVQGQLDASGKMYMRNRYYDPMTGRFTQEDPIGLAGGANVYGFGSGDPINYDDPFGLCPGCAAVALAEFGVGVQVIPGVGQILGGIALVASAAVTGYSLYKLFNEAAGDGSTGGETAGRRATKGERQAARDRNRAANDGELRCVHCGQITPEQPGKPSSSQVDHVQPRNPRDGGPRGNNHPENLKNSCRTCNLGKSNKRPPYTPPSSIP